jgi:hypothetical protein
VFTHTGGDRISDILVDYKPSIRSWEIKFSSRLFPAAEYSQQEVISILKAVGQDEWWGIT